jgi:hypothetical protein
VSNHDSGMSVRDVLSPLARGTSILVGHPSAVNRLRAFGFEVEVQPALSADESNDRLFEARKTEAREVLDTLPPIPQPCRQAVVLLYKEMIECRLFGLHGAAITSVGILVEFALKFAIYLVETGSATAYDSNA